MLRSKKRSENPIDNARYFWGGVFIVFVFSVLLVRIWYLQIYKYPYYSRISENNRVRRIDIPSARGAIYDRSGKLILGNRPFYDLVVIPQYLKDVDTTLTILSNLLHLSFEDLQKDMRRVRGQAKFIPVLLKANLSLDEVALIESQKPYLPGVDISIAPRRDYKEDSPPHLLGYIGEISSESLENLNEIEKENPYSMGDLVGKQGLELQWESLLRGKRGFKYIQVDALGRQSEVSENLGWKFEERPAEPGADLTLTIDSNLQRVAMEAFQGKQGAVIAMNPQNGEIYALVSAPGFDPAMYQEGISYEKWQALIQDPFKPLFDKTTGGTFPPASAYKTIVAMAALEEGIITPQSKYNCRGVFTLGNQPFRCHKRIGHGPLNLSEALMLSCDVYFYHLGVELGMDRIAKYAKAFGFGEELGLKLNKEQAGVIPTVDWWKRHFGSSPNKGDVPSLAIGQGANSVTPLQIASMYASIANGGKVWRPYLVRKATDPLGETVHEGKPELIRQIKIIKPRTFQFMRDYLLKVVSSPRGTGRRARVKGVTVAGKTSTAQVVSLNKNAKNSKSTKMQWLEHAIFAAFSPVEKAEIVVVVVSENDLIGMGGRSAAPVAQRILQAYWDAKKAGT